jgi:hypothetical protein
MDTREKLLTNELKVYVDVLEDRLKDGTILPREITWEDGMTYAIDQILDKRKAASLKCGGAGLRYKVRIGETVTYMWLEEDKWFVKRRAGEAA